MTFENYQIPCYIIDLVSLNSANEISRLMKPYKVTKYTYEFKFNSNTLKYGLSNDENSHTPVERVYRLSGHIPGWSKQPKSSSGSDMRTICDSYATQTGITVHKNQVVLIIHDFSYIASPNISDPDHLTKKHERYLIKNYETKYGQAPIGNIKTEKHMDYRAFVSTETFDNLFVCN